MNPREILIYLSLNFDGDYKRLRQAIEDKEYVDEDIEIPNLPCRTLTIFDEEYPEVFKEFYQAPLVLYYYGDISLIKEVDKNLAIVGTRVPTEYGSSSTKEIVEEVSDKVNIVSGLARGIDAIAQEEAMRNGGKVIAVLGSGIDFCYPSENKKLYEEIKKKGLIISEYPNHIEPSPDKFPFRNRLIAMMSNTVLITEAYARSGTSITANYALAFNKNICCIPYPRKAQSLCNRLIASGANLVQNGNDVLEIMNIESNESIFDL